MAHDLPFYSIIHQSSISAFLFILQSYITCNQLQRFNKTPIQAISFSLTQNSLKLSCCSPPFSIYFKTCSLQKQSTFVGWKYRGLGRSQPSGIGAEFENRFLFHTRNGIKDTLKAFKMWFFEINFDMLLQNWNYDLKNCQQGQILCHYHLFIR